MRIAKERSYTFILIIPRRKTSLCEALHGRRPYPDLKLHGSSPERGRRRGRGAAGAWLGGARLGGHIRGAARAAWLGSCVLLAIRKLLDVRKEKKRRKKERRKRKGKKEKKKIWEIL
jgi:hypothetical protein